MAAGDTTLTIVGNLVEDPNLRFTQGGHAVASFRIASTPRYLDTRAAARRPAGFVEGNCGLP